MEATEVSKTRLLVFVFLLVHAVTAWLIASKAAYPTDLDERAHVSYAVHLKSIGGLFPRASDMRLISPDHAGTFSEHQNYLQHPSSYYWILVPFAGLEGTAAETAQGLRWINLAISVLAVAVILFGGVSLLEVPTAKLAFVIVVVFCPKIAVIGGMVNNDNLALLGGGVALLGFGRLIRAGPGLTAGALLGAGVALAGLAKLTGAVTVGAFVLFGHVMLRAHWQGVAQDRRRHLAALVLLGFIGAVPYIANMVLYGFLLPMEDRLFVETAGRIVFAPLPFVAHFASALAGTWGVFGVDAVSLAGLTLTMGLAIWGATVKHHVSGAGIASAGLLSLAVALSLNIVFIYLIHLDTGHMAGMSVRYFLPLWPAVALGVATAIGNMPTAVSRTAWLIIVASLLVYGHTWPLLANML